MFRSGHTPAARRTPRRKTPLASGIGATLGAMIAAALSPQAAGLTITGNYTGGVFHPAPYYTCGPDWNCADPVNRSPAVTPTADWVVNTFEAAARYWERRIDDPWTVTVDYGWRNLGSGPTAPGGINVAGSIVDGRYTAATITLNNALIDPLTGGPVLTFISPAPGRNDELKPPDINSAVLPAGAAKGTAVTTQSSLNAIPYGPLSHASQPINGAYGDLLSLMIHELAHALNMDTASLRRLSTSPLSVHTYTDPIVGNNVTTSFGLVTVPDGPLKGTTIPWTPLGGGHTFLKPAAGMEPNAPPPAGYPSTWLDSPLGEIATNATIIYGPHRKLVTDLDAVIIAAVSNFRRVNLDTVRYVALPEFTGATTPRPENGTTATLLTVNGVAALAPRTDASGATVQALRLTPDTPSSAGSAFLTKPFSMSSETSFRSSFSFRIGGTNGDGALGSDGFAFVVHRDPRGAAAIANAGGDLGYGRSEATGAGLAAIARSLAIEFDTHRNGFDADDNHIAFLLDGDVTRHLAVYTPAFALNDGLEHFVWIEYDAATDYLSLFLSDSDMRPGAPVLRQLVDLSSLWGSEAYFGFTAATGGGFNSHDILSWNLEVDAVPENESLILLASALIVLAFASRRARRSNGPAMAS